VHHSSGNAGAPSLQLRRSCAVFSAMEIRSEAFKALDLERRDAGSPDLGDTPATPSHPLLPSDRRLDVHLRALRVAVDGFIDEARHRIEAQPQLRDHPTNLIESMVAARDRKDSGILDEDVVGNVLTMLLAGEDTTANTLAWMIWLLHCNPDAARRATEEVRAVVRSDAQVTHHEQLHALDFVEACAHETMRLKPVAPLNIQQAVRDSVVGNVRLPAGTLVMCLMRPAAVDERHLLALFRGRRFCASVARAGHSRRGLRMLLEVDAMEPRVSRRESGKWLARVASGTALLALQPSCTSQLPLQAERPHLGTMKSVATARTSRSVLPTGQLLLTIEHDMILGVRPQMLRWWLENWRI
jgi:hypothetical protein